MLLSKIRANSIHKYILYIHTLTIHCCAEPSYSPEKVRPLLPLPHNTNSDGIGVISIGNGSTKQWNN